MLTKVAQRMTNKMILQDVILEEDRELYEYGMVQGVIMIINWITAFLIGVLLGMPWQPIILLILFTPVRIYAGGFHASTQFQCYIITSAMMLGALAAIKYISLSPWICLLVIALTAFGLFVIAPVEAENKPMSKEEYIKYGGIARRNWLIEVGIFIVFYLLQWEMMCRCIVMNFLLISILLIMGKIEEIIRLRNQ